ncbi:MAG: shikimate kinase [Acidimicrobiales bacterium]
MSGDQPIVLVGLMGAGKTPTGTRVAERLGWPFHDGDDELEARLGITPAALAERDGTAGIHASEAALLLDFLVPARRIVVAASASTIEDPRCRYALREPFVAWLHADPAFLAPRAGANGKRPVAADVEGRLRDQEARRSPLYAEVADIDFDVATTPLDAIAAAIVARVQG